MSGKTGRPRNAALDAAIAAATEHVLLTDGYNAVTIDRVAARAGTTRTAVYRRFSGRLALVTSVLAARFGTEPAPDTGDLRRDLTELQHQQVAFFRHPLVAAALTGLLADIGADSGLREAFHESFLAPRRRSTAAMLRRAVQRGDIPAVDDPSTISDMLTGPLLLRAVLPTVGGADDDIVRATVAAVLHLLRYPARGAEPSAP